MLHLETFKIKISTTKNGGFFININGTKIPFDYSANADYMIQAQNYLTSKNYHVVGVDNINKIIVASNEKYDVKRVFTFSELSNKAVQSKVIEKWQNESYEPIDCLLDTLVEIIESLGFSNANLDYSFSYSQSDYFRFAGTFEKIDLSEMKKEYETCDDIVKIITLIENSDIPVFKRSHNAIEISEFFLDTQENLNVIKNVLSEIDNMIKDSIRGEIEYQLLESTIIETIDANGYEFYENGEMV